jgi:5-methylcytosine-specific restriction endonuclease McrA
MWFACIDGKTKCADGTGLSAKCHAKGCAVCGELEETAPTPAKATTSSPAGEYNRADWPHWIDADGDCQDTRAEILIRDNVGTIKFKRNKPCNVSWGRWVCPYTGKVLNKASDVDIDHIVPLSHAHATGGAKWTREQKKAFANDPDNLLAVDDATNQAKGDKGPAEWMPPRREYWPEYARKWRAVKVKYGLTIGASEERALRILETQQRVAF